MTCFCYNAFMSKSIQSQDKQKYNRRGISLMKKGHICYIQYKIQGQRTSWKLQGSDAYCSQTQFSSPSPHCSYLCSPSPAESLHWVSPRLTIFSQGYTFLWKAPGRALFLDASKRAFFLEVPRCAFFLELF